uniref:Nucleotide-diphospho-sugar transferase domain-containing protein n=1 Tax=Haptolina ericina TaxID=156174 RepID=A0A7S3AP64_9EUKA|mmetsp:Transcript_25343/g.57741  ORF Transcript_25343/g.57741 Transcript_25343/m.57741 type:complete len:468 (+) Transcript_25343:640-2043(+)|eukprot:CAMPEP_0181226762 /NCGR_PEP_ID=MMETSP1096-20121128/32428_1 /TAXON_ID=156174 ORGANISM="Chrysochromulina ericina, Strain CCMP281" /NCGR_SAMPLE_ID=MMETSP1096 /ASSEMBLY_ACC=CAM_ASM_000453 /LENGTH=467 /DNA_ID=CAMNT_0023320123 /DNA_START=642 /DNA_END=2045 /DNA_ORIENTATION=+
MKGECSWHAACDLDDLRRPRTRVPDYTTVYVKDPAGLNSTRPTPRTAPQLAIATMASGSHRCALVQWCERVQLFATALRAHIGWRTDVVVISPAGEEQQADCPLASFVDLDSRVAAAMKACAARASADPKQHSILAGKDTTMQKLLVLSLVRYDFVVFADADVDFIPFDQASPRQAAEHFMALLTQHLPRSEPWWEFVGNADPSSPINAGLFIVRPSVALYEDALAVLSTCRFNTAHGWDYVGRPQTLTFNPRHPDGEEAGKFSHDIANDPIVSHAFKLNNWAFTGANIDQGILWYLFHIRRRCTHRTPAHLHYASVALFSQLLSNSHVVHANVYAKASGCPLPNASFCRTGAYFRKTDPLKVLHWWYVPKPWMVGSSPDDTQGMRAIRSTENESTSHLARAYAYLSRSAMRPGTSPTRKMSPCMRALWTMRRAIEDDSRFEALADFQHGIGLTVPLQPFRARMLRI